MGKTAATKKPTRRTKPSLRNVGKKHLALVKVPLKSDVAWALDNIRVTKPQFELIQKTVCKNATPEEMQLYFYDCARQGVHPLDRLIHFTKRHDNRTNQDVYVPITSIDFFRMRSEVDGQYAGMDEITFEEGEGKYPKSARCTIYRMVAGVRCPTTVVARWTEYAPADLSKLGAFMWRDKPHVMLGKCCEALARRVAFPRKFAHLYIKEEFDRENDPDAEARIAQRTEGENVLDTMFTKEGKVKEGGTKQIEEAEATVIESKKAPMSTPITDAATLGVGKTTGLLAAVNGAKSAKDLVGPRKAAERAKETGEITEDQYRTVLIAIDSKTTTK